MQLAKKGITWVFSGQLTPEEILNSQATTHGLPSFDDLRYQVIDLLDVMETTLGIEDIERLAAIDMAASKTNNRLKVAFVVTDPNLAALCYLYEAEVANSPWQTRIFQSSSEATHWVETND